MTPPTVTLTIPAIVARVILTTITRAHGPIV
jgi:hypothetical protein